VSGEVDALPTIAEQPPPKPDTKCNKPSRPRSRFTALVPPAKPIELPDVTLVCVDCVDPRSAAEAIRRSKQYINFARVLLFSHDAPTDCDAFEWIEIDKLENVNEYNLFVLRDLHRYIDTSHTLTVQTDGYVVNPGVWDDAWLAYDYIGAPWRKSLVYAKRNRVGNSGFCLRSKRLLELTSLKASDENIRKHANRWPRILDDVFTCHDHLRDLELHGIKFAPVDVAAKFAFERPCAEVKNVRTAFGFHGEATADTKELCLREPKRRKSAVMAAITEASHPAGDTACKIEPAPPTRMRSPADMSIIQIEITNACPKKCSNCTRFVSHVRKPFMMDLRTFKRAVDSMEGFRGMLGIMGGEPTIHPQFDAFCDYFRETIDRGLAHRTGLEPFKDLNDYRSEHLSELHAKRGLWSSVGNGFRKHHEQIFETFDYMCLNDHANDGKHQALLISRHDLKIPDDEWYRVRDRCWVQRLWSASITPTGCYFCEVAAAIDMLFFNGRRGWPIEPGWWKRTPAEFGEQLELCELCSAPLDVPRRLSREEIDDVSASNYERLKAVGAPSVSKGRVAVLDATAYQAEQYAAKKHAEWYLPETDSKKADNTARISPGNRSLYAKRLDGLLVCVGYGHALAKTIPKNVEQFDRLVVVTTPDDRHTQAIVKQAGAELVISDRVHHNDAPFSKACLLNDGLQHLQPDDWVVLHDADILLSPSLRDFVMTHVLNPGVLYYTTRYHAKKRDVEPICRDWRYIKTLKHTDTASNRFPWGYFQLVNARASALAGLGYNWHDEWWPTAGSVDNHMMRRWPAHKRVRIDDSTRELSAVHLYHGNISRNWNGISVDTPVDPWVFVGQTGFEGKHIFWFRDLAPPCWLRLVRTDDPSSAVVTWWSGRESPGVVLGEASRGIFHLGFFTRKRLNDPIAIGVHDDKRYGGWGQGATEVGTQAFAWGDKLIAPVQLDLYATKTLPAADKRRIVEF